MYYRLFAGLCQVEHTNKGFFLASTLVTSSRARRVKATRQGVRQVAAMLNIRFFVRYTLPQVLETKVASTSRIAIAHKVPVMRA